MASTKKNAQTTSQPAATEKNAWRAAPATDEQIAALCKMLRLELDQIPADLTKGEAADRISSTIKERNRVKALPPTGPQLDWLEREAGYNRQAMSQRTRGYCSSLIYKTKKERGL